MTREEREKAIDALKISAPVMAMTQEEFNDYIQTLNKIMDWLEQEPTTKNDLGVDCISRADARHLIAETFRKNLLGMTFNKMFETLYKGIDDLPSVTSQESRKGHWLGYREYYENLGVVPNGLSVYKWCSNCDCGIDVREWHRIHYNYCPNCGADMREVKE